MNGIVSSKANKIKINQLILDGIIRYMTWLNNHEED